MPELLHVAPRLENMPSSFTIVRQNHCAALTLVKNAQAQNQNAVPVEV